MRLVLAAILASCALSGFSAWGQVPAPTSASRPSNKASLQNICVFSQETTFATANVSTASNRRLQQLREEAQAEADRDRQTLRADLKSFEDGQAGLTPALLKQLQNRLSNQNQEIADKVALRTRELEQTRQQVTQQIEAASAPIIREMERLNNCTILLRRESVIDAPGMVDITAVVIAAMNSRLQTTSFQRLTLNSPPNQ